MQRSLSVIVRAFVLVLGLSMVVNAQTPITPTPLNILWRLEPYGRYMTSSQASERNEFASTSNGAIFYIPNTNVPGTAPLYRLYQSTIGDHMDSLQAGEGGYTTEGLLGYAWTSSNELPNLWQFIRVSDGNYHATTRTFETLSGYGSPGGLSAWGLSRYGTASQSLLALSAGGVTIQSNGVAGGALWSWTWNGTQFINTADYGRYIQSSVFYPSSSGTQNPTEAGDQYSGGSLLAEQQHSSPVFAFNNSGNTQVTNSVPLEWNPASFGGGSGNPVIYSQMLIGKQITLNYNNLGPVAEYVTTLTSPMALGNSQIEIPTGYLNSNFNTYWTYDAGSNVLQNVTSSVPNCNNTDYTFVPGSGTGGVIISDAAGANAMGVYGASTSLGGSVSYFSLWNFVSCDGTSKWDAVYGPGSIPDGSSTYHSWIMTGSVSQVQTLMQELHNSNVR